jgi:hypothetical protein
VRATTPTTTAIVRAVAIVMVIMVIGEMRFT